jgi:hypothetical protein
VWLQKAGHGQLIAVQQLTAHAYNAGVVLCEMNIRRPPVNAAHSLEDALPLGARKGLEGCEAATPQAGP